MADEDEDAALAWLLVRPGGGGGGGTSSKGLDSANSTGYGGRSCVDRPPTLCRPQKGSSSRRDDTMLVLPDRWIDVIGGWMRPSASQMDDDDDEDCGVGSMVVGAGMAVVSVHREKAVGSLPVLYPSGTDFRTRMPTSRRLDWTPAGSDGVADGAGGDGEWWSSAVEDLLKKSGIWRCDGSEAAPAKGRFALGPDIGRVPLCVLYFFFLSEPPNRGPVVCPDTIDSPATEASFSDRLGQG